MAAPSIVAAGHSPALGLERALTLTPVQTIYSGDMGKPPIPGPDLLPGTLYLLILRTLRGGPLHGYAIARRIKDASAQGLEIEDGSLYPSLNRMLVKGWLAAEWGVSENNRKARFYRITRSGHKLLEAEARGWEQTVAIVARFFDVKAEDF